MKQTLDRYILKQWLGSFLAIIFIATGVLLLSRVLKILGLFSDKAVDWSIMLTMVEAILPYFLVLTVPIAFFMAVQALILHLQKDSEMDALRAAGLSYHRILRSIIISTVALWLLLTYATMQWVPQGQMSFQTLLVAVQQLKAAPTFDPGRFSQELDGFTIYIDGQDEQGLLHGFLLEDTRETPSTTYIAKTAELKHVGQSLQFTLYDGSRLGGSMSNQQALQFDRYQVAFNVGNLGLLQLPEWKNRAFEMSAIELWDTMQAYPARLDVVAEWHRRLLLPTSVFVLLLFALPLSVSGKRSGKSTAYLGGIALMLLLYNMQIVLHQQVLQGQLHWSSMWAAQGLLLLLGFYLYRRVSQDHLLRIPLPTISSIKRFLKRC